METRVLNPVLRKLMLSASLALSLTLAFEVNAADDQQSDAPFGYPASLIHAPSTYTVSPATPVVLGKTVVVLERSRLIDVAAIARAPVHTEGTGKNSRRWVCVAANNAKQPLRLWFIASGQDTVTEVQMSPGTFIEPQNCGSINEHFEPVYLSRIASGMRITDVINDIGPASHKDGNGWRFWVYRRSYSYFENQFTEYVWLGAKTNKQGLISDVFTTQVTR